MVVEFQSDLTIPGQMDGVVLLVRRAGATEDKELSYTLGASGGQLPLRTGLIPASGGESEELTLTARARKGIDMVVEEQVVVQFVPNERRLVQMFLASACISTSCQGTDQTCSAGGTCVPRRRGSVPLPTDPSPPLDAAADGPDPVDGPENMDAPTVDSGDDGGCLCPSDDNPCTDDVCEAGNCQHKPLADRTACTGGLCLAGACCTGCIGGQARCRVGTNAIACGSAAGACVTCNDQDACTQDRCEAGSCRTEPLTGNMCPTGVCVNGQCHCGGLGEACCPPGGTAPACEGGQICQNGTCGACGAQGQGCCSSNTCASGLLCTSGSCVRCGELGGPCCADLSCRTGVCAGGAQSQNKICQPCGGAGQACCTTGDACGANLGCSGSTCACGGFGQPCCDGTGCTDDRNQCNGAEVCQAGKCGRTGPVTCKPLDSCHGVGICDPGSGLCSNPLRPDGTACNDPDACTSGDVCRSGICTSGNLRTVCNDNQACTTDTCVSPGGCVFTPILSGVTCPAGAGGADNTPCTKDVCDGRGNCAHPPVPNGTTCPGIIASTCQNGVCCSAAACAATQ
jgi:hypothetical protein